MRFQHTDNFLVTSARWGAHKTYGFGFLSGIEELASVNKLLGDSEGQRTCVKEGNAPYVRSLMVDEERTRPGHWLH